MSTLDLNVYMDSRPVKIWWESVTWGNPTHEVYRSFSITFIGWHEFSRASRWDIYGTRDPAVPRSELLIRQGIVPPDRQPVVSFDGKELRMTVAGYDWAWMAQRQTPTNTLVVASSTALAQRAVRESQNPVGRWRWIPAATLHDAVRQLGLLAGFTADLRIPNYRFSAALLDPAKSYWQHILDLTEPFAPEYFFRRTESRVLIADRAARAQAVGTTMALSEQTIKGVEAGPSVFKYVRRVIVRVPRWL
jgi:hypothetical protein